MSPQIEAGGADQAHRCILSYIPHRGRHGDDVRGPWLFDHGRAVAWTLAGVTVLLVLHHYDYISTSMSLAIAGCLLVGCFSALIAWWEWLPKR